MGSGERCEPSVPWNWDVIYMKIKNFLNVMDDMYFGMVRW